MEHECIHGINQDWCALCKKPLRSAPQDRVHIAVKMGERYSAYRIDSSGTELPNGATIYDVIADDGAEQTTVAHFRDDGPLVLIARAMTALHSPGLHAKLAIAPESSDAS